MLLAVVSALTGTLALYALGHYVCALAFVLGRRPAPAFDDAPADAVTVLVRARNEGERAARAVASLLAQDHPGPVHAVLLVRDEGDDGLPALHRAWGLREVEPGMPPGRLLDGATDQRRASVFFAGADPKAEKINAALPHVTTRWVAILDCDHEADPDWIRSSLSLLSRERAVFVQGRRRPLDARGLWALWDSLHQHVGCEVFNVAFSRLGLTCFFTGTTAVLEAELLRRRPLGRSLTEDIDFSYGLLMDGVRIIANPWSGSQEEVSPDLYSFLARRRRWANGHTVAFRSALRRLPQAPLRRAERVQFVLHGLHYLVSFVVCALQASISLVFVRALSPVSITTGVVAGIAGGWALAGNQRTLDWKGRATERLVASLWLVPGLLIVMNFLQALLMWDLPRAALPIPEAVQVAGVAGFAAPAVLLLVGLAGLGQLGGGSLLAMVLSYPVAFFVDILGVLFGLADLAVGGAIWRRVSRARDTPDAPARPPQPLSIRESWRLRTATASMLRSLVRTMTRRSPWIPALPVTLLFVAGVLYLPTTRIPVLPRPCVVQEHDGHPWIVPPGRLPGHCTADGQDTAPGHATGTFRTQLDDPFSAIDARRWAKGDKTFFCNLATFDPKNVLLQDGGGVRLRLQADPTSAKGFSAGHLQTTDDQAGTFTYGRFEVTMQPIHAPGVLSAMFLYRFDPWQEIDLEFVGTDTSKVLLNVFYNPGEVGDLFNYGYRGTPVVVDLGFDAALAPHRYAIEWEQQEIRWYVDGQLLHARRNLRPTPIPHLPMRLHVNAWPICSEELAGPFAGVPEPMDMVVRHITIARWSPPPLLRLRNWAERRSPARWRAHAEWMTP